MFYSWHLLMAILYTKYVGGKNNHQQEPTSWAWCVASAHTLGRADKFWNSVTQRVSRPARAMWDPVSKTTKLYKRVFLLPHRSTKTLLLDIHMNNKPVSPFNKSWKALLSYLCLTSRCCFKLAWAGDSASFKSSKLGLAQLLKLSHFLRKHKKMPCYGISPKNFQ